MENTNNSGHSQSNSDHSGIILGTSSDAIIEGLHHGDFVDTDPVAEYQGDDKDQIVNQQEQNEIINPVEKDYEQSEEGLVEQTPEKSISETISLDKEDTEILEDEVVPDDEVPRLPNT